MRGLKNDERTKSLLDGYVINYNFCRKHQSINMTPAEATGIKVKGWRQLIETAQVHKIVGKKCEDKQIMEVLVKE